MKSEKKYSSSSHENSSLGISKNIHQKSVEKIKLKKEKIPETEIIINKIRNGDIAYLSKSITLVESKNPEDQKIARAILNGCLPFAGKSVRIGITGVPGVGKSTFIESLGNYLTTIGKKVAVLAIDPTSSVSKGSILGDKTRMEKLAVNSDAFIRPSPAGDSLGGVARMTRETILLCEAANYDIVLIETLGVGQAETIVHSMVDFFLLLKLAGAGDELQGIKRGIVEMADAIIINKADGDNIKATQLAMAEFARALHLYPSKNNSWVPVVTTCSAINDSGIKEIWDIILKFLSLTKKNKCFEKNRNDQNRYWVIETINNELKNNFYSDNAVKKAISQALKEVDQHSMTSFDAAMHVIEIYNQKIVK
jgi:LAO/AO transport system kinase